MTIVLLTYGSMGDVQPFVALALGLQRAGHDVRLAAPSNFARYIQAFGLPYAYLHGDTEEILHSREGQQWLAAGRPDKFLNAMNRIAHELREALEADIWAACRDADALVAHALMIGPGVTLSELRSIPVMAAYQFPIAPETGEFPELLVAPRQRFPGWVNRLTYRLFFTLYDRARMPDLNRWRVRLGLKPLKGSLNAYLASQRIMALHAYSPHLVPRPKDWGEENIITGNWKIPFPLPAGIGLPGPSADLLQWMEAGSPPVYLGFGSMPVQDPKAFLAMTAEVMGKLGSRAVIAAGWSHLATTSEGGSEALYVTEMVDHSLLFPHCRAAIHHGGAGTTAASLGAGLPTGICSVFADQPFWGDRLTRLGVGTHVPFRQLSSERLSRMITTMQSSTMQVQARQLGELLSSEQGVETAVQAITEWLPTARPFRVG